MSCHSSTKRRLSRIAIMFFSLLLIYYIDLINLPHSPVKHVLFLDQMAEPLKLEYNLSLEFTMNPSLNILGENKSYTIDGYLITDNTTFHGKKLTFEDLAQIPDDQWLKNFSMKVYELYPQNLPMENIVERIKNGEPISDAPINNVPICFVKVPSSVCFPSNKERSIKHDSVIIFKSAVYNFAKRAELRRLYYYHIKQSATLAPNFRIGLIFSIGLPRICTGDILDGTGRPTESEGRASISLAQHCTNPAITTRRLREEMDRFDDLLVGDYEDTYYNLTLKMMHTLQWGARLCQESRPTFLMIDDDFRVNTTWLQHYLTQFSRNERGKLLQVTVPERGRSFRYEEPLPNRKWAVRKADIPWPLHVPYGYGAFTLIGFDTFERIAIAAFFTKMIFIDDVWLGMVVNKLNLTLKSTMGVYYNSNVKKSISGMLVAPQESFRK